MANQKRFIWVFLASLLGLAALVAGLNLLVDPYEVFGTPRIPGISLLKPAAKNHSMLAKTYQVARAHPATVLIGSSPIHIGMNAADPAWPAALRPVFNYGIPGAYATSTGLRTLQEAWNTQGLKNVVVFLDFQNFFVPEQPGSGLSEDDRRFHLLPDGSPNPHRGAQMASDMFLSLATMGALVDSGATILSQRRSTALNLAPNGSSSEADFTAESQSYGMHDLFAQKDAFEAERAAGIMRVMAGWQGPLPNLGIVEGFISFAEAHGLKLTLVIAPHHAEGMEIYWHDGLWPRVEQLKTELAALVARHHADVKLWDFMDYSTYNIEAVPPPGDRHTATEWFWESTHFKQRLGSVMIERMFDQGSQGFGAELTPDNVAAWNAAIRHQREVALCQHNIGVPSGTDQTQRDGCPGQTARREATGLVGTD